ncbi:MAG: ComEC/Rec2 family competence protein, partial [Gemmatimonadetes bacterium]|nr:ComEC/Rec2 family competence protein [Gemmatimonadota bacterium]
MNRAPAVLWTATGFAAGAAVGTARGFAGTLIPLLILTLPILLWRGPRSRAFALLLAAAAGVLWGAPEHRASEACARSITDGERTRMVGYFTRSSTGKASVFQRLRSRESEGDRCRGSVRVYTRGDTPREARIVVVEGRWIRHLRPDGSTSLYLSASSVAEAEAEGEADAALRVPWTVRTASAIRARANEALERRLGAQAGVAAALVLADRDGIDRELWDAFSRSGTAHLLSISGFHVGVVAALLSGLVSMTGRPPRTRALAVAVGVWGYVLLIGAPTSATRAAWMATAFVAGRLRQTPARGLGALGLAMLAVTLLTPSVAAGAGFQLTVAGTAGILVMARWIMRHWPRHRGSRWIAPPVAAGLGASVFTAPVLAYHFGEIPLLSLPSSILLTPLVAAAVPGVIVTIALEMLHLPGSSLTGAGAEGALHLVVLLAAWLGELPGAVARVTPIEAALLSAGALLPILFGGGRRWRVHPATRVALATISALATLWVGQGAHLLSGRGALWIAAIDVGQGDAIAIRTPKGRWLLVDAGPRGFGGSDAGASRVVPYLRSQGARRLEAIVLTHPDEDHAGGLASVLREIPTAAVLGPGLSIGQEGQMLGAAEAIRAGIPWRRVAAGDSWTIDGVDFRVLHPVPASRPEAAGAASPNDWSVVRLVEYRDIEALLLDRLVRGAHQQSREVAVFTEEDHRPVVRRCRPGRLRPGGGDGV